MTAVSHGNHVPALPAPIAADPGNWVEALSTSGPEREDALRRLHQLLLRAARRQIFRMHSMLSDTGREEIANQAADEAMVALLGKLSSFEGRSQFTTWAYKFAILQAAVEMRRQAWRDREVPLDEGTAVTDRAPSPEQRAEAADLAAAVTAAIDHQLTPHQRRIVVALLVDDVPIDVLADRLGTTRNALYKTLHDARVRLRAHLMTTGHLTATTPQAGNR